MKKQPVDNKLTSRKRNIIAAILLIVIMVLLIIFVIRPLVINNSGDTGLNGNNPSSANRPTVAPNEIAPDEILFTINGQSIPMSVFGYFLYNSFSQLENRFMTNELDFNSMMGEGVTLGQYVISNSIDGVKFNMVTETLAEELGLDRVKTIAEVDEYLASTTMETFGGDEDSFRDQLALMGTTLESFRDIMISQSFGNQAFEHYYGEAWVSSVDPSDYYDQFVTTSDILLLTVDSVIDETSGETLETPLSEEVMAQKRALADTILDELKAGADFFELLNIYGEDQGVMIENNPKQRYTFQGSEMMYDYSIAAFSIEVGEYSDVIEAPYGYYIIYKLPLDTEQVAETVKTQEFRNGLFNLMLNDLSKDYTFESTPLFDNAMLDTWYREYKDKNYQTFN